MSPELDILYVVSIVLELPRYVKKFQYADDEVFYVMAKDITEARITLERAVADTTDRLMNLCLKVLAEKT